MSLSRRYMRVDVMEVSRGGARGSARQRECEGVSVSSAVPGVIIGRGRPAKEGCQRR